MLAKVLRVVVITIQQTEIIRYVISLQATVLRFYKIMDS